MILQFLKNLILTFQVIVILIKISKVIEKVVILAVIKRIQKNLTMEEALTNGQVMKIKKSIQLKKSYKNINFHSDSNI